MALRETVMRLAVPLFIEGPAGRQSYEQFRARLEASRAAILTRVAQVSASEANLEQMRHVIGIERWGQRRLRVALGEPPVQDVYRPYRPEAVNWEGMAAEFGATRDETLALLERLSHINSPQKIPHNSLGPLSVKGWLHYLNLHADFESRRLR